MIEMKKYKICLKKLKVYHQSISTCNTTAWEISEGRKLMLYLKLRLLRLHRYRYLLYTCPCFITATNKRQVLAPVVSLAIIAGV